MNTKTLQKVITVANKNPKALMGLRWYLLVCNELNIEARPDHEAVIFSAKGREEKTNLITEKNADKFKARVKPGSESIMIFEFMKALVILFTEEEIPAREFAKLGERAEYYVNKATEILNTKFGTISAT